MGDWEKFNKTLFPEKEDFYSNLKPGRYYRWRLQVCKESLEKL